LVAGAGQDKTLQATGLSVASKDRICGKTSVIVATWALLPHAPVLGWALVEALVE